MTCTFYLVVILLGEIKSDQKSNFCFQTMPTVYPILQNLSNEGAVSLSPLDYIFVPSSDYFT